MVSKRLCIRQQLRKMTSVRWIFMGRWIGSCKKRRRTRLASRCTPIELLILNTVIPKIAMLGIRLTGWFICITMIWINSVKATGQRLIRTAFPERQLTRCHCRMVRSRLQKVRKLGLVARLMGPPPAFAWHWIKSMKVRTCRRWNPGFYLMTKSLISVPILMAQLPPISKPLSINAKLIRQPPKSRWMVKCIRTKRQSASGQISIQPIPKIMLAILSQKAMRPLRSIRRRGQAPTKILMGTSHPIRFISILMQHWQPCMAQPLKTDRMNMSLCRMRRIQKSPS